MVFCWIKQQCSNGRDHQGQRVFGRGVRPRVDNSDHRGQRVYEGSALAVLYHVLVLKKNVHKPGHFQNTIHYEAKSFSCPRTQKGFTSYYMHFSSYKICSQKYF